MQAKCPKIQEQWKSKSVLQMVVIQAHNVTKETKN